MRKSVLGLGVFLLVVTGIAVGQSDTVDLKKLETEIPALLERSHTPGLAIAVVKGGKTVWTGAFGVKNTKTGEGVTGDTIFEAASLTKPIVAYAALKLVDQGKLDLDVPLNKYLGSDYEVVNDRRIDKITARRVLSHTSGFPNWRPRDSKSLPINFEPGEKFSYSGEGFVYLSKVIEKITSREFSEFVKSEVLQPLGMKHSSIDWEEEYYKTKAFNHDALGIAKDQNAEKGVNAAASLHTTAEDYAKFVTALMKGEGLSEKSRRMMLEPQVGIDKEKAPGLFWGLGWGIEESADGKSFWHWGDNGFNKSFVIANPTTGKGLVFFTNGANGMSFLEEVLEAYSGEPLKSAAWLGYERFDSVSRKLFKSAAKGHPVAAVSEYVKTRPEDASQWISERQMNRLGYNLMRVGKKEAALAVFRQNTVDYPESANVWDSLAECYLELGDKISALRYYKKSLSLDPENKNAEAQIAKIEKDGNND